MNEQEQRQVNELTTYVLTYLAPSKVHGVGVFALRDLKKGETLFADMAPRMYSLPYEFFVELPESVRTKILERWPQVVNGSKFVFPDTRIQAFMNHGGDKANYDAINDVLLADVKKGKEITEDYRKIPGYEKVFPWLSTDTPKA